MDSFGDKNDFANPFFSDHLMLFLPIMFLNKRVHYGNIAPRPPLLWIAILAKIGVAVVLEESKPRKS